MMKWIMKFSPNYENYYWLLELPMFYYFQYKVHNITFTSQDQHCTEGEMAVMQKLRMFVVQEPVVAASFLIAGVGTFLLTFSFNP